MTDSPDYIEPPVSNDGPVRQEKQSDAVTLSLDQLKQLIADSKSAPDTVDNDDEVNDQEYDEEPFSSDEEAEVTAPAIDDKLAAFVDSRLTEEQSKEKLKTKFAKASRPINVNHTKEVKINKPLFKSLSVNARRRDVALRNIQSTAQKAVNNLTKVADLIVTKGKSSNKSFSEDEFKELHCNIVNGLGLVCKTSY